MLVMTLNGFGPVYVIHTRAETDVEMHDERKGKCRLKSEESKKYFSQKSGGGGARDGTALLLSQPSVT